MQSLQERKKRPAPRKTAAAPAKSSRRKVDASATDTPVARLFAVLELASKMGMISAADVLYMAVALNASLFQMRQAAPEPEPEP